MFRLSLLWEAPQVNRITGKALSIPILNPLDVYGRVFNFAWFGFFVAFWSCLLCCYEAGRVAWLTESPKLTLTIAKDVGLTPVDIANSNITALVATLLVRLVAGPCCDRFGARYTFAAILLLGAIPTALAGAVTNARGLIALRFFVGILGGTFVPCQVWTTAFFDKNVVGTANALTGGWGNSGGGITYFIMPAIFDSLVLHSGYSAHVAWRVAFIVPFIVIVATALGLLLLCPDTPQGKWSDRYTVVQCNLAAEGVSNAEAAIFESAGESKGRSETSQTSSTMTENITKAHGSLASGTGEDSPEDQQKLISIAQNETIQTPTLKEAVPVVFSLHTLNLTAAYFCSFGAELAINSILGAYYLSLFAFEGQTSSGRWAAMFGILNIVCRPLGGIVSDALYAYTRSLWAKKLLIHFMGVITGAFLIAIGLQGGRKAETVHGLVAGMAVFLEAGNGANFSLVPHVHPYANGIVSGLTGAAGNLGGIVFAIIFRVNGVNYNRAFWIIGIIHIGVNLALSWVRPAPQEQFDAPLLKAS